MRRLTVAAIVGIAMAVISASCGGKAPDAPTPGAGGTGGGGGGITVNTPPTVKSVVSSDTRAEVGTPITITATVEDTETPVANLTYTWSAPTGTFSGSGAVVTWTAGADAVTPADVVLTLTVSEKYVSGGAPAENTATGTVSVHLNNSPKELAELSLRFLGDFADSRVSPEKCVSEFSASCAGKMAEFEDIASNRHDFLILASTLRHTRIDPAPAKGKTKVHTFCAFTSRVITKEPERCSVQDCPFNSVQSVEGDCVTTSVYEQGRWWLCDSSFENGRRTLTTFERAFFGLKKIELP
jgi:hypothetical protein